MDTARKYFNKYEYDIALSKGQEYLIPNDNIRERTCHGAIMVMPQSLGLKMATIFNERQRAHIKNNTFQHKMMCLRRPEPIALMFLSLGDIINGEDYKTLDKKALCSMARSNILSILSTEYKWVIQHSKYVLEKYYNVPISRLRTKLNFVMDDGKYSSDPDIQQGGIICNGLIELLEEYNYNLSHKLEEPMGIICQILAPSGLPEAKKWLQIDVGLSTQGKRRVGQTIYDALENDLKEQLCMGVSYETRRLAQLNNKLFYTSALNKGYAEYDGFDIHIWEILTEYDYELLEEQSIEQLDAPGVDNNCIVCKND